MLLFMIASDSPSIANEYRVLMNELEQHNPELLDKKRLLAITKADMIDEELEALLLSELPADLPPTVFISSLTNKNIQRLKDMIWGALHG
jgi:GTP-binding protein